MVEGLKEFIKEYKIKTEYGKLVFYKAVSKEWGSLWVRRSMSYRHKGAANAYRIGTEVIFSGETDTIRKTICGKGLHIGTLNCARLFTDCTRAFITLEGRQRKIIKVLVDPEDVICVPLKHSRIYFSQKIRCKRLHVVAEVDQNGNHIKEVVSK